MDDMANLYLYCMSHPDWFESPQRLRTGNEYLSIAERHVGIDWRIERSGPWHSATPEGWDGPAQGWKIHVSAIPATGAETLDRALPVLVRTGTCFKFAADRKVLRLMGSGSWPRAGASKFITVYPSTTEQFRLLLERLTEALDGLVGPYVLSDRRPGPGPVHYRFGGFRPRSRLEPDGSHTLVIQAPEGTLEADHRLPYWHLPAWTSDPLAPPPSPTPVPELADGRYLIEAVLGTSTKGGVYRALDRRTGERVVVKEARPHVAHDDGGRDAITLRRKEYDILVELAGTGIGPRPVDFFHEWEHAFLVEELVPGIPLGPLTTRSNPLYFLRPEEFPAYFRWIERIGDRLEAMLATLHGRGITFGDLSLLNILVDEEDPADPALRLIDFETAVRTGIDPPSGTMTPGFSSPESRDSHRCAPEDDRFSLGRVLFTTMVLSPGVLDLEPTALDRYLRSLTADIGFPQRLADRIRGLAPSPAAGPLAQPSSADFAAVADAALDYVLAHADTQRSDRLFPSDPMAFATNPLSVAYGAAGLAHAVRTVRGDVPAPVWRWMLDRRVTADRYAPSLYHGLAGIAWVLAEGGEVERGEELLATACSHPLVSAGPGILHGRSGVGLAALRVWSLTGREAQLAAAVSAGEELLLTRVERDGGLWCWPLPDGAVPIGYAHGASGIGVFLLTLGGATRDARYLEAARRAIRFDLSQARDVDGRFTAFSRLADGAATDTLRHYWAEGSAGIGTAALRLWMATGEPADREALDGIIADCSRIYTAHTGLFNGLAGMANFLVDAYAAIGDPDLLRRAEEAARGLLLFAVQRPEGIAFPGDQGLRLSGDFATGGAGVALTLHRVARPSLPNFNFVVDSLLPVPFPTDELVPV